jgi:hypothetical protein
LSTNRYILGHFSELHDARSVASEALQEIPSGSGGGLLQILVRTVVPPLQETEHSVNCPQELHPPLTNVIKTISKRYTI